MSMGKQESLSGWGHYPVADCLSFRPERQRDVNQILSSHRGHLLARGLGRSYGDAALQPEGTLRTQRLDHIIGFDTDQGVVQAQAGLSLADLMALSIPKGWLPPVIPGTRHVTLGGAFASNVHGKNQFSAGDFAEHVLSARVILANGDMVECSPDLNSDLFWATAGGMGMTGIIDDITLKLRPIASASLQTLTYRVNSIYDMVAAFEQCRDSSDYMVGWIDHMAKADSIGRGIFESARHIATGEGGKPMAGYKTAASRLSVPCFMPPSLLNRYVMAAYNSYRFKQYSTERKTELVGFDGFFHPLDSIGHWNRLYGKRGFFQYECLVPEVPNVAKHLYGLLLFLQEHGLFSFLAVLKYHRDGKGLLTFSKRGYSLALDFPNTDRVRALLPKLDQMVANIGGRVYLAKDALLTPELFRQMYGDAGRQWYDMIHDIDPNMRFTSLMSERLQWKTP